MNSKPYLYLGLAILMTASCSKTSNDKTVSATEADQGVVAKINGSPISQQQLDRFITAMNKRSRFAQKGDSPEAKAAVKKMAIKNLIRMELLYQESQAKNIIVNGEELDKMVNKVKSQFPDDAAFQKALAERLSSEEKFREDIRRNLAVDKLIDQEVLAEAEVSEEESTAFYQEHQDRFNRPESVQVSHILVRLDKNASPEDEAAAKQKIEEVKKRLGNAEDFAELARTYSDCPSAETGGDLGYIVRGQTVPEFEKCAFELEKPDQISQVIKTPYGFHILKSGEKRQAGEISYEDAQETINQYLKNQKLNEELERYVQKLHANAKIESQLDLEEPPPKMP